jgi:hypothetical protein
MMRRPHSYEPPSAEELKRRAEARFKAKEQQQTDSAVAMREYRAAEQAARDRTEKLRAARLAHQAAGKPTPRT